MSNILLLFSGQQDVVTAIPVNTVAPVIAQSGDQIILVSAGVWTGGAVVKTYQLQLNGVDISGATSFPYTWQPSAFGQSITVVETGTNVLGSDTASSNAVNPYYSVISSLPDAITLTRADTGSSASYYDATPKMVFAASDVPRFHHDPATGAALGLLLERESTNLLTDSKYISSWSQTITAYQANQSLAPDGTTTLGKIKSTSSTVSRHQWYKLGVSLTAQKYSWSAYSSKNEQSWAIINSYDTGNHYSYFDILNGKLGGSVSGAVGKIIDSGNGLYRCIVTKTPPVSANGGLSIEYTTGTGVEISTIAVGSGINAGYAQLEAGEATSYIDGTIRNEDFLHVAIPASMNTLIIRFYRGDFQTFDVSASAGGTFDLPASQLANDIVIGVGVSANLITSTAAVGDGVTDDTAALNSTIASNRTITLPPAKTYRITSPLVIPSDTYIDFNHSTIKLADAANDYLIVNSDWSAGNSNITLIQGVIDGNGTNQTRNYSPDMFTGYFGFGTLFYKVNNLIMDRWSVTKTNAWGIAYHLCGSVRFTNFVFNQIGAAGTNGDGITGSASDIYVQNVSGYTNDDIVAVGTGKGSLAGHDLGIPDVDNIDINSVFIDNIQGVDQGSASYGIGLYPYGGHTIKDITISNVSGIFGDHLIRGVQYWTSGGYFENFTVTNMDAYVGTSHFVKASMIKPDVTVVSSSNTTTNTWFSLPTPIYNLMTNEA